MARSPYTHSDRELLARIARSVGGKAGYKQLIRELGLGGGRERRLLLEQLTRMVARGDLRKLEEDLWAVPKPPEATQSPSKVTGGASNRPGKSLSTEEHRSGREHLASGRLELHRDGYGFVRPGTSGPNTGGRNSAAEDIFIPPNALHGAMHGDMVLVDEDPPARDGRRSGRIARVLTRRNPTLVGLFHYGRPQRRRGSRDAFELATEPHGNFVQPLDERLGGAVEIPEGAEWPSPEAESPHRTIGAEASPKPLVSHRKNGPTDHTSGLSPEATSAASGASRSDFGDLPTSLGESLKVYTQTEADERWPLEGMAVEVEITSFAQPGRPARGRVVEILGRPDAFGVDVEIIIRKHVIPHTFPAPVLAEANERATQSVDTLPPAELREREDFRGLPIVTIDGETARDFDDAVLVRALPNGNTELQVHIADVSWYVLPGSALDTEARVRGTSVYFPDRAVPMLPHALSSGMCSLRPDEDRLVQSCIIEIDARGEVAGYRVAEGIIRSARRMTYTSVQRCLSASPAASAWNQHGQVTPPPSAEDQLERERIALERPDVVEGFDRMLELALRLNRKRVRRGSIDFDLPEPVVEFDPDGNMKAIVRSERGWSHRLIEEFMLCANECVATWLTAQGIPSMYRIHEMPDPKRILEFEETAAGFGQTLGIGALPVKRVTVKADRREAQRRSARGRDARAPQAREVPESIPVTPQMYQRLIRRIEGHPEERILSYLMLRSLKQARYSEKNEGHFALASPCYTHFTSPIRRYPDLIVHRLLRAMLQQGADPHGGPVHSTDQQPWDAELKRPSSTSGARSSLREPAAAPAPFKRAAAKARRSAASASEGRIGWASDDVVDAHKTTSPPAPKRSQSEPTQGDPIPAEELADIAVESSQAERRAADAERELIEWKKMKFMADRIGDDFSAIILSVTKFGFFVELDELFIEGLVPLGSLVGDFYTFRDTDRTICGTRTGHCFRIGDHVHVLLDRIDRQQRRLQFALTPGTEPKAERANAEERRLRNEAKKARAADGKAETSAKTKRRKRKH